MKRASPFTGWGAFRRLSGPSFVWANSVELYIRNHANKGDAVSELDAKIAEVLKEHQPSAFRNECSGSECDWVGGYMAPDRNAEFASHQAAMLNSAISAGKAQAWHAGRESIAIDMLNPMGDDSLRPQSPNPYGEIA